MKADPPTNGRTLRPCESIRCRISSAVVTTSVSSTSIEDFENVDQIDVQSAERDYIKLFGRRPVALGHDTELYEGKLASAAQTTWKPNGSPEPENAGGPEQRRWLWREPGAPAPPICPTAGWAGVSPPRQTSGMSRINEVLEALNEAADRDLGAVVLALDAAGEVEQADALVACELGYDLDSEWGDGMSVTPVLSADPSAYGQVKPGTLNFLEERCRELNTDWYVQIGSPRLRLRTPGDNWRRREAGST